MKLSSLCCGELNDRSSNGVFQPQNLCKWEDGWFALQETWCRETRCILMPQKHAEWQKLTLFGLRVEDPARLCAWPSLAFQAASPFGSEEESSSNMMWFLDKVLHSSASGWWVFCHLASWIACDLPASVPFPSCLTAVRPTDSGKDGEAGVNKRDASGKGKQCLCFLQSLGALDKVNRPRVWSSPAAPHTWNAFALVLFTCCYNTQLYL